MKTLDDKTIKNEVWNRIKEDPYVDLSDLDISRVTTMDHLFSTTTTYDGVDTCFVDRCVFCGNISSWDTHNILDMRYMFYCNINFNCDISGWVINPCCRYDNIFEGSIYDKPLPKGMDPKIAFGKDYDRWFKQKIEKTIKVL